MKNKLFNVFDLLSFLKLKKIRKNKIEKSNENKIPIPHINQLATQLHPFVMNLIIKKVIDETKDAKTFILEADGKITKQLPYFIPGQYISIVLKDKNSLLSRSFSISSSPKLILDKNQLTITVKKVSNSLTSDVIFNKWKTGTSIEAYGPFGKFSFNPIRDNKNIIAIAGSCGITPFLSMAQAIEDKTINEIDSLTILYGNPNQENVIAKKYFDDIAIRTNNKIKCIYVYSQTSFAKTSNTEHGFIDSNIIKKYVNNKDVSYFVCGNNKMLKYVNEQLERLNVIKKYIHCEGINLSEIVLSSDEYKQQKLNSDYKIEVRFNNNVRNIKARGNETILVALERNGIFMPNACRSGRCGRCIARLIKGNVYIPSNYDFRRKADKNYGYIYTCCTYPASDNIVIEFNSVRSMLYN